MEAVAARTLPDGYAGEWTDTSFQEKRAEGKTAIILGFAVLFAYLFLVALYESWTIPVPVLLSVTVGVLGSFAAIVIGRSDPRSLCPDRHGRADRPGCQERHSDRRVRQGETRERRPLLEAATEGARLRFRPVMMTSFAFILGLLPLVIATGASQLGAPRRRHAGVRRDDPRVLHRYLRDPAALRHLPGIRERLRPSTRPQPTSPPAPTPSPQGDKAVVGPHGSVPAE